MPRSLRLACLLTLLAGGASPVRAQQPAPQQPAPQQPAPQQPAPQQPAPQQPGPTAAPPAAEQPAPAPYTPAPSPLLDPATPPSTPPQAGAPYGYPTQAPVYPPAYAPPSQPTSAPYGTYTPPNGYPSTPSYGQPAPAPGSREHDGFFLRMKVGFGAGGLRYKEATDGVRRARVKTRGMAWAFDLALGGAVTENLILHGNLNFAVMDSHKKVDGVEDDRYDDLTSVAVLFGAGATYYFMPTNLYLTLVVGTAALSEERSSSSYFGNYDDRYYVSDSIDTGAGFGTSLSIGKEWWVGRASQWGLGVDLTGAFYAAPAEVSGDSQTLIGHAVSINFTATFN